MSEALVVPVRVEALPVGERDTYTALAGATAARGMPPYADFAAVAGRYAPYLGAQVVSRAFSGGRPLERGVHVHWHLPRALLRAPVEEARAELAPPPAPDRWLVTRMLHVPGEPPAAQAWVVESNFLAEEPLYSETTFPRDLAEGGRPYAYLGRVYTLEEWVDREREGSHHPGLTAFGYGIPDFAGCYANCRNVFGLRDRGLEAESGARTLTYAVVGWHDDPARDPLADGGDPSDLGWMGSDPGPRRTLYFGSIHGVRFDPAAGQLVGHQSKLTPDVALGNTPAEALAALAARGDADQERLFTAFQLGALRRLGGLAPVEEQVHAASFTAVDAGVAWDIRARRDPQADPSGEPPAELRGEPLADLDVDLAEELSALNADQRRFDSLRAELTSLRRRLFADWCRRVQLRGARWRPEVDLDGLDDLIEAQLAAIDRRSSEVDELAGAIGEQHRALSAKLPKSVKLVEVPAPRYHRPNDPVVVLSGDGVVAPPPDAKDEVACVRASELPEPPRVEGLDAADRLPDADARRLVTDAGRLVRLALAHGPDAPGLPERAIALQRWKLPWRPIELAWRAALQLPEELDTSAELAPDVVLDNYELDPGMLDLDPEDDAFHVLPDEYEGRVPLSANASAALEVQLEGVVGDDLLKRLRERPLIAQALGGFTQALAMLDQELQLPVADPDGSPLDAPFVERVAAGVAAQWRYAPLPDNPFAPLRSGRFRISALRLVDEFGRWREVDTSGIVVSETIPRHGSAMLPPLRLTQPARLGFRWRMADRPDVEASSLPSASPICGWVVPNRLDHGIMLYDAEGSAIGRFTPSAGDEPPLWYGAPGADRPTGTLDEALAGCNEVLRGFARSLAEGGPEYLPAFCATLTATGTSIAPRFTAADQAIAVLLGEPLVLVRAELDLSLLGLPSIDMSLGALRHDIASADLATRTDRGVTRVRFPVLLGNLAAADDGLVGFYLPGAAGEEADFSRFYAVTGGDHPAITQPVMETITVTAAPKPEPVAVTMLMDPRCAVHATTGILPVKALSIPGDLTARGLAALDYTFLTGPLIVAPGSVSAPAPAAAERWKWIGRRGDSWPEEALAPFDPALMPPARQRVVDGWLRIDRSKAEEDAGRSEVE